MNFRIFKCKDKEEALVYRWINDDCGSVVKLKTFVKRKDEVGEEDIYFHSETITFGNEEAAKRFIKDFSQEAAQEFIDRFVA